MVKYILDGSKMLSRETAHDELQRALSLPEYYGRNLDALWDCVSAIEGEIVLQHSGIMLASLGLYGKKIVTVFEEAAEHSSGIRFSMQ